MITNDVGLVDLEIFFIINFCLKFKYEPADKLEGHTNNICVVDGMYYKSDCETKPINTYLASASVDSTVRIWTRQSDYNLKSNQNKFSLEQVITSKMNGFALALKFYLLPLSNRKYFLYLWATVRSLNFSFCLILPPL